MRTLSLGSATNAWQCFLQKIAQKHQELHFEGNEECFYRGHGDDSWLLLPSLLRHTQSEGLDRWETRELEAALFFEFQARARELHGLSLSDWDVLFFMRHHAVVTRLLDWTEVLGVAVYFAIADQKEGRQGCVWLLNPYALNETKQSWHVRDLIAPQFLGSQAQDYDYSDFLLDWDDFEFGWEHLVALYPLHRSHCLHAQRGYFTIHGDSGRPLERLNPRVVRKVLLPHEAIPAAEESLALAGISDYLLFPDLDGLTRELHRKYAISPTRLATAQENRHRVTTHRLRRREYSRKKKT